MENKPIWITKEKEFNQLICEYTQDRTKGTWGNSKYTKLLDFIRQIEAEAYERGKKEGSTGKDVTTIWGQLPIVITKYLPDDQIFMSENTFNKSVTVKGETPSEERKYHRNCREYGCDKLIWTKEPFVFVYCKKHSKKGVKPSEERKETP